MTDETILSKITKLLALATSDNENEAAIAASKAQTLLIEYNISQEELESFSSVKNEKVIQIRSDGKTGRNRSNWYNSLAYTVAKANLCTLITSGSGVVWIGKKTNIEVAQYIFDNLVRDLTHIADFVWAVEKYRTGVHGKTWKNNFYYGAIQTISERLNANLQMIASAPTANALIVRNDVDLAEYMKVKYPRLTYHRYNYTSNRSAFEAGKSAGRQVQFRQGIGAGGSNGPKLLNG